MYYNIGMIVYRFLCEKELHKILNGDIKNLGRKFIISKCNTHRYNPNKKYMHFFKSKDGIAKIQQISHKFEEEKKYICEFEIPMMVLMRGRGFGYYNPRGYDVDRAKLEEFRVSTDVFKTEWLRNYTLVEKNNIICNEFESD